MMLLDIGPLPEFLEGEMDRELDRLLGVADPLDLPLTERWRPAPDDAPLTDLSIGRDGSRDEIVLA